MNTTNNTTMALALFSAGIITATSSEIEVGDVPEAGDAEIGADSGYQGAEVTTMTSETTTQATETTTAPETQAAPPSAKPAKAPKPKKEARSYPFLTKAQIAANIENSFAFACTVIGVLYDRQTAFEQETKSTLSKNKRGFMSSHAVHGTRIARDLANGVAPEALSDEDKGHVLAIAPRYTKQMAEHFRAQAIEADPTLAAKASCFFTAQ